MMPLCTAGGCRRITLSRLACEIRFHPCILEHFSGDTLETCCLRALVTPVAFIIPAHPTRSSDAPSIVLNSATKAGPSDVARRLYDRHRR